MKPATRVIDVTTNMTGEKVGMTIDNNALAHVMSILTDLYSDQELACIREYSTNALDSHIEAGVKRPIEVNLPGPLSPYLSIRDYGSGLDIDDIRDIYSRYGTSTKRESNDVVGMLGLGCKSALTYTDQFTLTAIKNGKSIQVSISRDENGSGSMMILDERDSDDPSGVHIMIPAKMGNHFGSKAMDFFKYWEKGTVLVNGVEPKRIDGIWLSDNLLLTTEVQHSIVVMGNVPYPMLSEYTASYGSYHSVHAVAFVDIGEVHFTPSRESLQATTQSKQTCATIRDRVRKEKEAKFLEMIDAAPTRWDAFKKYKEVKQLGFEGDPVYKGQTIPLMWKPPTHKIKDKYGREIDSYKYSFICVNKVKAAYGRNKSWNTNTQLHNDPTRLYAWVYGYNSENFTPYKRAKMDQYFAKHPLAEEVQTIVFVPSLPDKLADWTPSNRIFKWSDIEAEKVVREARPTREDGRPTGSYRGYVAGTSSDVIVAGDIDTKNPLFWIHGSTNLYYKPDGYALIYKDHPKATLIVLSGNRIEKFKRDFPMAQNVGDYLKAAAQTWNKSLSKEDRILLHMKFNSAEANKLSMLDHTKINDPVLSDVVKMVTSSSKRADQLVGEYSVLRNYGAMYEKVGEWKNPLNKYFLLTTIYSLGSLTGKTKEHVYIYLNAAHKAAEKEGA